MIPPSLAGFWIKESALPVGLCTALCRAVDGAPVSRIDAAYQQCDKHVISGEPLAETTAALRSLWAEYLAVAPHMGSLARVTHIESPFVLRYESESADHFDVHSDVWNAESALRQVSLLIYLNDADGGETVFPNQRLRFEPKAGRAIFYPAFWPYPHQALPPRSGRKYVLVSWFCFPVGPAPYWNIPL